eukprot:g35864.t1
MQLEEATSQEHDTFLDSSAAEMKEIPVRGWAWVRSRKVAGVLLFVLLLVLVVVYWDELKRFFGGLLQWFEDNRALGVFVFILVYIIATVFFLPGSVLSLGAGLIWGLAGIPIVVVGAGIGLTLAFLVGRYLFREWVAGFVGKYPKFRAVDHALEHEGWKVCLLLRLAPLFPFNGSNYLFSITKITFSHYVATSVIGIIPGTTLYVWLGSLAPNITEIVDGNVGNPTTQIVVLVVTGVVIIVVFVMITVIAKRALKRLIEEEERAMDEDGPQPTDSMPALRGSPSDAELIGKYQAMAVHRIARTTPIAMESSRTNR